MAKPRATYCCSSALKYFKFIASYDKLKRQLRMEKSTMKSIVEMITMAIHLLQTFRPRVISILICILSFTFCGAANMPLDAKRVNKVVIKMVHYGTCFEEDVHMSRFFWNYSALRNKSLVQKELNDSDEIQAFCSMLTALSEETAKRPIFKQSVSMSPSKINARDCLVPYLLNHLNDLPRCNHFIDAFQVRVKIELYSDNGTHYSVIWANGITLDYKRKRYVVSNELKDYFWEINKK